MHKVDTNNIKPTLSRLAKRCATLIANELPLEKYCVWETRWISNWMESQPPANWIILETEKEVLNSVFHRLAGITKNVFHDPGAKVVDYYILPLNEAVIVKPLLTESPMIFVGKIMVAAPEKILVDIVAEPDLFRAQQGELDRIFDNAIQQVNINQTKMLRYARRRRRYQAVLELIPDEFRLSDSRFLPI